MPAGIRIPEQKEGIRRAIRYGEGARSSRGTAPRCWTTVELPERFDRCRLVVLHVEDGVQLGDLQQVMDLLGQVQQLQFPALVADGSVGADQLADPRTVY